MVAAQALDWLEVMTGLAPALGVGQPLARSAKSPEPPATVCVSDFFGDQPLALSAVAKPCSAKSSSRGTAFSNSSRAGGSSIALVRTGGPRCTDLRVPGTPYARYAQIPKGSCNSHCVLAVL